MLGTPYYMSPEQALGQTNIDHRTDIWSLGIIAYECLTGARPFDRETLGALLMAICNEPLPTPSSIASVPPGFDAWFARAAARNPTERFASAAEATAELRAVCEAAASTQSPVLRGDTVLASPSGQGLPEVPGPPTGMDQTAVPSSVTLAGRGQARMRGVTLAVTAALVLAMAGIVIARAMRRSVPSDASTASARASLAAPVAVLPLPVATVAARPLPSVTAELAPPSKVPSATEPPPPSGAIQSPMLPRAPRKTPGASKAQAPASASAFLSPVNAVASGVKQTPARNYDKSVGF
jgi:hypothetical protein